MKRVLVTAALGKVGREVVAQCSSRGIPVRAADLDDQAVATRFPSQDAARLDFLDKSTWGPALSGCDGLFLLRPPPLGDMSATLCPFVDAAYRAGVQHIVFLSVMGADRKEWVPHRKVERHLMASGDAWTILRPGFFAQNLQDAYRRDLIEDDRIYVPAGEERVAFVDVRDVAEVAARVFDDPTPHRAGVLTLTGGEAITFEEVARLLTGALLRPIRYQPATVLGYAHHLRRDRQLPWMQVVVQSILHLGLRRGDARHVDPTLERILARPPRTVAEYVRDAAVTWTSHWTVEADVPLA